MAKRKEHDDLLSKMRERFRVALSAYSDTREEQLDDLRFYAGNSENGWQWPSDVLAVRGAVGNGQTVGARPCLTVNKLPQHVRQVTNDQRQNRPSGKVIPADDKADVEVAEIFNGIVRHIEYISDADVAYDTACENQVIHGEGFIRLLTEYCSDDTFDQDIKIGRVRNPFSVYLDPLIQDPCGTDAHWAFITEDMSRDEYERTFKDAAPISTLLSMGVGDQSVTQWIGDKTVRIAEYFYIEYKRTTLNLYPGNQTAFEGSRDDMVLRMQFGEPQRSRQSDKRTVRWIKTNGFEVLEDREWPGKYIPIVRVVGNEFEIEGQIQISGLVRNAKDPQRMYNYWPLALDTPVPTPDGWSTIGDLRSGDQVFDENGVPVEVVGTTDTFIGEDCYRVTFDDGSSIVASGNHQWQVERRGKRTSATFEWQKSTVSTVDMVPGDDFIYVPKPLQTATSVTLDPYFLGIVSVEPVASVPVKCITVASENHLFLVGKSMIPTHNCSQEAEMLALAPKAPFIGYGGQFEGYENQWKTANTQNWPYLEVNPDATDGQGSPLPLPQRAQPPMASSGLLQAKAGASEDIKSATGQYDASLGIAGNERSGKAILARQKESDTGTYHYVDNLARAVRYITRQLVDLIPKIYDTNRIARIIGEDGSADVVKIDPLQPAPVRQIVDEQGIVIEKIYNPGVGRYDVVVVTGPGYATKRQEALEAMAQLLQGNPELWKVAGDLFVKNMDWPGAQEMAKRFARTIPPEIMEDGDDSPALQAAKMQIQAMAQEMEQMHGMLRQVSESMEAQKLKIEAYNAETKRISAVQAGMTPEQVQDIVLGTIAAALDTGDIAGPSLQPDPVPEPPMMEMPGPEGMPEHPM